MNDCGSSATSHPRPANPERGRGIHRSLSSAALCSARTIQVRRQHNIYTCGDQDKAIYWLQKGSVKLAMSSQEGRECIFDVYAAGDFFGESCLAGLETRVETATALENAILKQLSSQTFIRDLSDVELLAFLREINRRNVEKQMLIAEMATLGSEVRLGRALLRLGSRLGKNRPAGTLIDCKISQEELSRMVGTTRPRITEFMTRFRRLGLVQCSPGRQIILKEARLRSYLSSITSQPGRNLPSPVQY